jgi:hypothetical protein
VNMVRVAARALELDGRAEAAAVAGAGALAPPRYRPAAGLSAEQGGGVSDAGSAAGLGGGRAMDGGEGGERGGTSASPSSAAAAAAATAATAATAAAAAPAPAPGSPPLTPLSIALLCMKLLGAALPEASLPLVAPRLAAGIALLLRLGPSPEHLLPLSRILSAGATLSQDEAIALLASPESGAEASLLSFFDTAGSVLDATRRHWLAAPGVWDGLCALASAAHAQRLWEAVTSAAAAAAAPQSAAVVDAAVVRAGAAATLRVFAHVLRSTLRSLLLHLHGALTDDAIVGTAAAILLADGGGGAGGEESEGGGGGAPSR